MSPATKWIALLLLWIRNDEVTFHFGDGVKLKGRVVPNPGTFGRFMIKGTYNG